MILTGELALLPWFAALFLMLPLVRARFSAPLDDWVAPLSHYCSGSVDVLSLKPTDGSTPQKPEVTHLIQVTTIHPSINVESFLRDMRGVTSVEVADVSAGQILAIVTAKGCHVCQNIASSTFPCFLVSATMDNNGSMVYEVVANRQDLDGMCSLTSNRGSTLELVSASPLKMSSAITPKQQRILDLAMETGFYDYPRGVTQEELSRMLGISASDLNEILRRAEKKIIGQYVHRTTNGRSVGANGFAEPLPFDATAATSRPERMLKALAGYRPE
jgi:predicted DNA binding protein